MYSVKYIEIAGYNEIVYETATMYRWDSFISHGQSSPPVRFGLSHRSVKES